MCPAVALALQAQLVDCVPMSENDQKVIAWAAYVRCTNVMCAA